MSTPPSRLELTGTSGKTSKLLSPTRRALNATVFSNESPPSWNDYFKLIVASRVYDVAAVTPLDKAVHLSSKINADVFLKREDTQVVFSFKLRGAYNRMSFLTDEQKAKGVLACSAGNHAQGVALAARYAFTIRSSLFSMRVQCFVDVFRSRVTAHPLLSSSFAPF